MGRSLSGRGARLAAVAAVAGLAVPVAAVGLSPGTTELISLGASGQDPVTDRGPAAVSPDGRYVAFSSAGRDIDPADGNAFDDVFVKDRQTGQFERVSRSTGGGDANGASTTTPSSLSADADRVAFASKATNLVPSDNNMRQDVFVHDRSDGTTELESRNVAGLDANGVASEPALSGDGSTVAFTSTATDMTIVPDLDSNADVYVRDIDANTTRRISQSAAGLPGNGPSGQPAVSADGSRVAFVSAASNLVAGDTNNRADVFLWDASTGQLERVSLSSAEGQANGDSAEPFISADGRYVGFSTLASTLGGVKYTNGSSYELYLRDTQQGTTERLSMRLVPWEGEELSLELSNGSSRRGRIAAGGRYVAFDSTSSQLVPSDGPNGDVFVLDRATDVVHAISRTPQGSTPNGSSFLPAAADAGVAFLSHATNLTSPGGAFNNQVFYRPFTPASPAADQDGDGVANLDDVCPTFADPAQVDTDGEGRGDRCDGDDDSDTIADPFEPFQDSDIAKRDTDGDGVDDLADDYPNDSSQSVGTDHQRLNVADLDSGDGEALAKFLWDSGSRRFDVRLTGALRPSTSYTVVVYRRHPAIRVQTVCTDTTNAAGALACVRGGQAISWFTHVELRRGSTVVATAACDDPDEVVGERRCDLLE